MSTSQLQQCKQDFRMILGINYFKVSGSDDEIPYEISVKIINWNNYIDSNNQNFTFNFKHFYEDSKDNWGLESTTYEDLLSDILKYEKNSCIQGLIKPIKKYDIRIIYTFAFSQITGRILSGIKNQYNLQHLRFIDINKCLTTCDGPGYVVTSHNNYYFHKVENEFDTKRLKYNIETRKMINEIIQKIARQFIPGYNENDKTLMIVRKLPSIKISSFSSDNITLFKRNYVYSSVLLEINYISLLLMRKIFEYEKLRCDDQYDADILFIIKCIYLNLKLPNYIRWKCDNGIMFFSILTGSHTYEFDNDKYPLYVPQKCKDYVEERVTNYDYEPPESPVNHTYSNLKDNLLKFIQIF